MFFQRQQEESQVSFLSCSLVTRIPHQWLRKTPIPLGFEAVLGQEAAGSLSKWQQTELGIAELLHRSRAAPVSDCSFCQLHQLSWSFITLSYCIKCAWNSNLWKTCLGRTDRRRDREKDCGNLVSLGTNLKINQLSARCVVPSSRVQGFLQLRFSFAAGKVCCPHSLGLKP